MFFKEEDGIRSSLSSFFFFQAEDGIRDRSPSRGLGDVYKRQILLTLRAMDEHGRWLPKARKVYDLDENGERIQLPSGNWKCHKENTVDWNDQKYAEVWRHSWETITNRYLDAAGRPECVDLRSFERQGIQQIPTVHLGPATHQMEKRGVETVLGNLNRDIRAANSLMQTIRSAIRGLQRWIADLNEKKQLLLDALEKAKEPTLSDLLVDYFNLREELDTFNKAVRTLMKLNGSTAVDFSALDFRCRG